MPPYKYVKRANHPLTTPSGRIPEHRVILFDKIGPGTHPCNWCGEKVTWAPGDRTRKGSLVVDHVDEDQSNNSPDNLVPSCQGCNLRRARDKRFVDSPFIIQGGVRQLAEERVCLTCKQKFLVAVKLLKPRKGRGRYCSMRCVYDRER